MNEPIPLTDEGGREYIPQDKALQSIYICRRAMGDGVLEAMMYTLEANVKASQVARQRAQS